MDDLDISEDGWTGTLYQPFVGGARRTLLCPLVASPELALLPAISDESGLFAARSAASDSNSEYGDFLRVVISHEGVLLDEDAGLLRNVFERVSMNLRRACLTVAHSVTVPSGDSPSVPVVVASVVRELRVLRSLPCIAMQTLVVTPAPHIVAAGGTLFVDHFVRAPSAWCDFDGSLLSSAEGVGHFVLSMDCKTGGPKRLSVGYLGLGGAISCEGFRVLPGEGAREARVRLRVDLSMLTSSPSFTVHVLCCVSASPRDTLLMLVRSGDSASLVSRHERVWEEAWRSRVDVEPKSTGLSTADALAFARDRFSLRHAMYHLHATGAGRLDLSGVSSGGASFVHVAIVSCMLMTHTTESTRPELTVPEWRVGPGDMSLGLAGLYLDSQWVDICRWLDPATGGPPIGGGASPSLLLERGLRPYASCLYAVSLWDYFRVSGDINWLQQSAFATIAGVADMVCSLAEAGDAQSTYPYHVAQRLPVGLRGFDEARVSASDQVLSVVTACAALRSAIQAAFLVAPVDPRKERWTSVMDGLSVPFMENGEVLALDVGPPPGDVRSLGDVLHPLCHPSLRPCVGSTGTQIDDILATTLAYWEPLVHGSDLPEVTALLPSSEARVRRRRRASNMLWILHARARLAQRNRGVGIIAFDEGLRGFFAEFRDVWGSLTLDVSGSAIGPDLDMSAALLLSVSSGLLSASIEGDVTDNTLYSSDMGGISAATSASLPPTWRSVTLMGTGRWGRDLVATNRLLLPNASLGAQDVQPWTVGSIIS